MDGTPTHGGLLQWMDGRPKYKDRDADGIIYRLIGGRLVIPVMEERHIALEEDFRD
jgi:hypothetical protein